MPQGESGGSRDGLPLELQQLLSAPDEILREAAWDRFVRRYNRLILHAAHRQAPTYDTAMDRYAYVLEKLREDEFRRLQGYEPDGAARFDTWLVVVARRLCVDHLRARYGRVGRDGSDGVEQAQAADVRRRLADLLSDELELDGIRDGNARDPDRDVRRRELHEALLEALEDLPARDRLLVKFRFTDDLTAREIAGLMGFPTPFHVYRRLRVVLQGLRGRLEGRGIDSALP